MVFCCSWVCNLITSMDVRIPTSSFSSISSLESIIVLSSSDLAGLDLNVTTIAPFFLVVIHGSPKQIGINNPIGRTKLLYTKKTNTQSKKTITKKIDEIGNFLELKDAKQKNNAIRGYSPLCPRARLLYREQTHLHTNKYSTNNKTVPQN